MPIQQEIKEAKQYIWMKQKISPAYTAFCQQVLSMTDVAFPYLLHPQLHRRRSGLPAAAFVLKEYLEQQNIQNIRLKAGLNLRLTKLVFLSTKPL